MAPAFFSLTSLDGSTIVIDATQIRSFRPTYGAQEPAGMTIVYFGKDLHFTPETGDELAARLQGIIAPARLTAPIRLPVWVDAAKVSSIEPARLEAHHADARAVLRFDQHEQQVAEEVEAAAAILVQAAGAA
jgi:hypothetical protein